MGKNTKRTYPSNGRLSRIGRLPIEHQIMRVYCFGLLGAGGRTWGTRHGAPWWRGLLRALHSFDGEVKASGRLRGVFYAWLGNLSVNIAGLFLVLSKGNAFGAFWEWLVDPGLFT